MPDLWGEPAVGPTTSPRMCIATRLMHAGTIHLASYQIYIDMYMHMCRGTLDEHRIVGRAAGPLTGVAGKSREQRYAMVWR